MTLRAIACALIICLPAPLQYAAAQEVDQDLTQHSPPDRESASKPDADVDEEADLATDAGVNTGPNAGPDTGANNGGRVSLDQLIPRSATDTPTAADAWASDGAPPGPLPSDLPAPDQPATDQPTPDQPVSDQPVSGQLAPDIPPPEISPLQLPEFAEPEFDAIGADLVGSSSDDGSDLFAGIDQLAIPPAPELEWFSIDDDLALAFPKTPAEFALADEFINRFRQLRQAEIVGGDSENVALRAARIRADRELLARQLRNYGYYDARISRSFDTGEGPSTADEGHRKIRFAIIPGEQYRFGVIDLGAMDRAPDYAELRSIFAIEPGDPLLADRIIARRDMLQQQLGEMGYPFFQMEPPELLIDHARSEGDLSLPVEPGGRYNFGTITSNMPQFLSARHLARIARFQTGDIYQASLEADLRRAILATGLVSSVEIERRPVAPPQDGENGELQLDVALEKGRLRTIAGALGYGTEDGLKVEASWEHRNLFPPEGALKIRSVLGTREQLLGVGFKRNNFRGRDQIFTLDAYGSDITTEAVEATTIGFRAAFERFSNIIFQKPLSWEVGLELLLSDERNRVIGGIARPRQEFQIGSIFGLITLDSSDSLLDPSRGFRASLSVSPEISRSFGEEVFYARAQADISHYLPAGDGITIATRGRFATIQGAQSFEIAPSRRIYAGGGASVRGYGFQAVGPRNDFGEPTGGRSLVELSAEARIDTGLFDGAVQLVPFFDLGTVSQGSTPDFRFVSYGAGLGIRYKTGFGPIRVDVGVPINRNPMFDSPIAVYVSLGQAF